jgi:ribosome recycling factor
MDLDSSMQKTVDSLKQELNTVRTGRATPALVENVMIEAYGATMRLMELATILAADAHTITIQPWDMGNLTPIRKGIEEAILAANVSEYKIAEIATQEGMVTMAQDGLIKALQGLTSVEEVLAAANIDTTVEEPLEEKAS